MKGCTELYVQDLYEYDLCENKVIFGARCFPRFSHDGAPASAPVHVGIIC